MGTVVTSVQLFFQEGSSDKVYHASIVEDAGTYDVLVEWGRRGSSLSRGKKAVKVTLASAQKTFDKLVREKTTKGYQPITGVTKPAAVAPPVGQGSASKVGGAKKIVGPRAQLLNPIDDDELEKFLTDDRWVAQQKLDGKRVIAVIDEDGVRALNRNGQDTAAPKELLEGVSMLPNGSVVDGEIVGDDYWLFDVLQVGERDVSSLAYAERHALLSDELEPGLSGDVKVLAVADGTAAKRALTAKMVAQRAEGLVFKDRKAPYTAGRPSSGGTQRKHKLIKTADVAILMNAGNAYLMCVYDNGKPLECGKVFAGTTNESRKEIDDLLAAGQRPVAEVKYLYATDDEKLFQPVFVRLRDDKQPLECLRSQLVKTDKSVDE